VSLRLHYRRYAPFHYLLFVPWLNDSRILAVRELGEAWVLSSHEQKSVLFPFVFAGGPRMARQGPVGDHIAFTICLLGCSRTSPPEEIAYMVSPHGLILRSVKHYGTLRSELEGGAGSKNSMAGQVDIVRRHWRCSYLANIPEGQSYPTHLEKTA